MSEQQPDAAMIAVLELGQVDAGEFAAWYDTEHLPERRSVPGILTARRWLSTSEPATSVAFYDLHGLETLESADYRAISGPHLSPWSRRIIEASADFRYYEVRRLTGDPRPSAEEATGFYVVGMNVEDSFDAELNAWWDEEHLPRLSAVPGVLRARRFVAVEGPHRYLAVDDLASPDVVGSPPWMSAAETPWTHRVRPRTSDRFKLVCRRPHPHAATHARGGTR